MIKLKTLRTMGTATLAVCALLLPANVSAQTPVTRPMHLNGVGIIQITDLDAETYTGTWAGSESGQATHLGLYRLEESGTFYFTADMGSVWVGQGTIIAADRDQLKFDVTIICDGSGETGVMEFTGGTGRFQGASGSVDLVSTTDPVTGAYTMSGTGTIRY